MRRQSQKERKRTWSMAAGDVDHAKILREERLCSSSRRIAGMGVPAAVRTCSAGTCVVDSENSKKHFRKKC